MGSSQLEQPKVPFNEGSTDWPHPDYAEAARACVGDSEALEKLRRLCDDLESTITFSRAPGSLCRVSSVPIHVLEPLAGKTWREALTNRNLERTAWLGLRNFGEALRSRTMDPGTRRTGRILWAVASAKLLAIGGGTHEAPRPEEVRHACKSLLKRKYLPGFLKEALNEGGMPR